ncbi:MAG: hypothetical protein HFH08_05880 [Bacilli bacterium]|nr:hypothetical protein [Bacilli bacterium]
MKIILIKKIGKNRYEILLENEKIKTYDTVMLKYQIALKKELSEELVEQIKEETEKAEIYEKVIQFLNKKLRSEKEVRDFLKKQEVEEVEELIERLKSQGFFHEDIYIEAYIHDRFSFTIDGPNKIREDLLKQNFPFEKVEKAIQKIDKKEVKNKLSKFIDKKMNLNHKYSEKYCKQKILEQAQLLGYSKELIESILEEYKLDHSVILEQEARKLYQRYSTKKSGKELIFFLKQKLYQKQYPMEDIYNILEKLSREYHI